MKAVILAGGEINHKHLVKLVNITEKQISRKIRYVVFHPEEFVSYRKKLTNKGMMLIWRSE